MIQINKADVRYFSRRWLLSLQLQKGNDFAVEIRVLTIREPEGRNKSEQVMTWLFVAKSEPCAFLYFNTEQGVGGVLSRAGATGLEVRGCGSLQRLVCQHWALNMIRAKYVQPVERVEEGRWYWENLQGWKTRQFALFWSSCTGAKGITLKGWLRRKCWSPDRNRND